MTTGSNSQPGDVFSQLFGANPLGGVNKTFEQFRKGVGDFIGSVESFGTTMKTLAEVAARVQALLDVVEEPLRRLVPQVTRTVDSAETLISQLSSSGISSVPSEVADLVALLRDVAARLAPLGQMAEAAGGMFGLRGLGAVLGGTAGGPTPKPAAEPVQATASEETSPAPTKRAAKKTGSARPAPKKRP